MPKRFRPRTRSTIRIGSPAAWALRYNGTGIPVAVGDSGIGIETAHPAFAGTIDPRSRNFLLVAPGVAFDAANFSDVTTDLEGCDRASRRLTEIAPVPNPRAGRYDNNKKDEWRFMSLHMPEKMNPA